MTCACRDETEERNNNTYCPNFIHVLKKSEQTQSCAGACCRVQLQFWSHSASTTSLALAPWLLLTLGHSLYTVRSGRVVWVCVLSGQLDGLQCSQKLGKLDTVHPLRQSAAAHKAWNSEKRPRPETSPSNDDMRVNFERFCTPSARYRGHAPVSQTFIRCAIFERPSPLTSTPMSSSARSNSNGPRVPELW